MGKGGEFLPTKSEVVFARALYGAATAGFLAGTKVRYYVEARSGNAARAARFAPARAEEATFSYRVTTSTGPASAVVINELMPSNGKTLADPQGDYAEWIELRNVTDKEVELTGHYLSDDPDNPRKWRFPDGTKIAGGGSLLIWADEDGRATAGLHANFKLSLSGEQVLLVDTDEHFHVLLDSVSFGSVATDRSYGRSVQAPGIFQVMEPTPGRANASVP